VGVTTLGWDVIDAIDVSDDGLDATVHFSENYAGYYGLFATSFLPEHYMATIPIEQANASYPISPAVANAPVNGPFKYVTASPDTIELERNENWRAGDHAPYRDRRDRSGRRSSVARSGLAVRAPRPQPGRRRAGARPSGPPGRRGPKGDLAGHRSGRAVPDGLPGR
jgi:hypothetical protein